MNGVLIRGCSIGGGQGFSVYCEGGKIACISQSPVEVPEGTDVIEANGGALYPGFVDSHCHPFEYGWLKRSVDLRGSSNVTGIRLRLVTGVQRAAPGEWVSGMGWDQEAFPDRKMPNRGDIDDVSSKNPVILSRVCGHIALLNSRALEALGLEGRTGEEYERDSKGALTGIVKERALEEVYEKLPRSAQRSSADLQAVEAEAGRMGITGLHCILSPDAYREELEALASLCAAGSLSLRYRIYVPPDALGYLVSSPLVAKLDGERVRVNGVKIYADGSLGARTAALRQPYSDDPSNFGILRYSDEQLSDIVERVDKAGMQAIIHAIGDRAVEQAVEALGRVAGTSNPRRHRVEHASLLPRDLRAKMEKHSIRATVQPLFITSDIWAAARLGDERVLDLYPLKSMLEGGIVASGSSDSPVESMSPVLGMWAAMTRGGAESGETLSLDQAISLYTSNAESNGFDRPQELREGSVANLTLLDADTYGSHPALFRKAGVLATIVGGTLVHSYGVG